MFGYPKMKGQLEDEVQALGFDHVVLVRPGLIVGERASYDSRAMEYVLRRTAMFAGSVSDKLKDPWAQDAETIARAAVRASIDCTEGKQKEKLRILNGAGKPENDSSLCQSELMLLARYRPIRKRGVDRVMSVQSCWWTRTSVMTSKQHIPQYTYRQLYDMGRLLLVHESYSV